MQLMCCNSDRSLQVVLEFKFSTNEEEKDKALRLLAGFCI